MARKSGLGRGLGLLVGEADAETAGMRADSSLPLNQIHPNKDQPRRAFDEEDLAGTSLVFTCTGDRALNARIADLCARARILCNCTDNPPAGTFHVPAVARSGHLAAALSTEGASPALSRRWKEELTAWLAPRDRMAALMGALRPRILALNLPTPDNTALFRSLSSGALEEALARQDMPRALALLQELLPKALHPDLPDVLNSLNL